MPTALELNREEWRTYIRPAQARAEPPEVKPDEAEVYDRLLARLRRASEALKRQFGVRRVVLFGSLAHPGWFIPDSDADIAIEGLNPKDYWEAWRLVEEIIDDRPVDFIEMERASDSLRRSIERHGIEL